MKPNPDHNDPKEKHQTSAHLYFNHRAVFKTRKHRWKQFWWFKFVKVRVVLKIIYKNNSCIASQTFEETKSQTFIFHISFTNQLCRKLCFSCVFYYCAKLHISFSTTLNFYRGFGFDRHIHVLETCEMKMFILSLYHNNLCKVFIWLLQLSIKFVSSLL